MKTAISCGCHENLTAANCRHESQPGLRVRRATVDDLPRSGRSGFPCACPPTNWKTASRNFKWSKRGRKGPRGAGSANYSAQHALLHSEGYSDFAFADAARELFWRRIETLAANHGISGSGRRKHSPFWTHRGFQPANAEILARLPEEWKTAEGKWLTLELKNEEAVTAALENKFAGFMDAEKKQTARVAEQARTLKSIIIVVCFTIGILCIGIAIYLSSIEIRSDDRAGDLLRNEARPKGVKLQLIRRRS